SGWTVNAISRSASGYDPVGKFIFFKGLGLASDYAAVLRSLYYQNNKPNPTPGSRTVMVELSDGTTVVRPTLTVNVRSGSGFTLNELGVNISPVTVTNNLLTPAPTYLLASSGRGNGDAPQGGSAG